MPKVTRFPAAVFYAGAVALTAIVAMSAAREVRAQPAPNAAVPLTFAQPATRSVHSQSTTALIYDVASGNTDVVPVPGDDVNLPNVGEIPLNDVAIHRTRQPPHRSFPKIVFGDGKFCSGTAIGRRLIITAGHCVFDLTTNAFRKSANVYFGYPPAIPDHTFKARRFIAFNGWTASKDLAHDVALIEIDTDLPPDVELFELSSDVYACSPNGEFRRHFYDESQEEQQVVDGVHIGCRNNMYFWTMGTSRGSSGSAAVKFNTNMVYAVYSFFTEGANSLSTGNDAPLTAGKICFIRNRFFGQTCEPPENVGPSRVAMESTRIEVVQGAAFIDIAVNRHGSTSGIVQIHYDTRSETAVDGRDFRRAQGVLVWGDGDGAPKTIRVQLIPTADPGCERQFSLLLLNVPAIISPPGDAEILGPAETNVGIIASSRPSEEKQLLLKQVVTRMDEPGGLPAMALLAAPDGGSLYSLSGTTIASFWRDAQRGTLRYQNILLGSVGSVQGISISADGRRLVRLMDAQVQVLARQPPRVRLSPLNGLGFDFDRYTQYDLAQSQDSRGDVYITAYNSNARRPGVLRYRQDAGTGALTDKWQVRAGEGGMPNLQGIYSIKISKDGRFVFAMGSAPDSLLSFRRAPDGTLTFAKAQTFGEYTPQSFIIEPYTNFVFVVASAGGRGRIFPLLINPNGDFDLIPPIDIPFPGQIAMSADSKRLYLTSGAIRPWLYEYEVNGTVMTPVGKHDPQRCFAKNDLNFFVAQPTISPDGRFVTLTSSQGQFVVVLQRVE